jgi:hypothetical protein
MKVKHQIFGAAAILFATAIAVALSSSTILSSSVGAEPKTAPTPVLSVDSSHPIPVTTTAQAQEWEYRYINAESMPPTFLSDCGKEFWELVTIIPRPPQRHLYILKRPTMPKAPTSPKCPS